MNARERAVTVGPEFEHVFEQYCRFVWRVLARLGVQGRDVPDVCQEVFLVVHRRLGDFDQRRGSLQTWIYGICARTASDYRRRHPNRKESSDELLSNVALPGQPEAELEARRAWERLARVLDRMEASRRQVFVLYELEGLSMTEVAAILGCPLQTAYSRHQAARSLVIAAFGDMQEEP